jgi:hypothetical protein
MRFGLGEFLKEVSDIDGRCGLRQRARGSGTLQRMKSDVVVTDLSMPPLSTAADTTGQIL